MSKVAFRQAAVVRAAKALRLAGFESVVVDLETGQVRGHPPGEERETEADSLQRRMREAFGEG